MAWIRWSIPSPSPSVKIQIIGGKHCLRCKCKTLLGVVNKLLKTKSLLTSPSNVSSIIEYILTEMKVMGSNPGYHLKFFLLYNKFHRAQLKILEWKSTKKLSLWFWSMKIIIRKSLLNKKNVSWQNFKAFITVINLVKYLQRSDTFNKIRTLSVSGVPLISLCFVKSDPKLD